MPSFGDLIGSFTGSTGRRALQDANRQATGFLQEGQTNALSAANKGYGEAQGYLSPYAEQGRNANTMYQNALGLNGRDAQSQFMQGFQTNPYFDWQQQQAARTIAQRQAAQGWGGSAGPTQLALSRALMERGGQEYNSYLDRLGQQAGQGVNLAGTQAQLAFGQGNNLAGIYGGFAQQNAANAINFGNASAQNANVFGQNVLGLGGLALGGLNLYNNWGTPQAGAANRLGFASPTQRA